MKRLAAVFLVLMATAAFAGSELGAGAKAPGFSLVNSVDGKKVTFKPGDGKTSVVIFTCNQCPYSKAFEQRIIDIGKAYGQKGVVFYAVNPNDDSRYAEETLSNMKARAKGRSYPFPYLKDGNSAVAGSYGARVTPHAYLVDGNGVIVYRGYVDDSAKPGEREHTGLTDALDSLLAKQAVKESETAAFGCTIKWKKGA